jgi:prepilin-type N-terminal cleavage/methylation domain-containing protein
MNFSARRQSRRAFTLVEVLATLVMLAIILPIAMRGVSDGDGRRAPTRAAPPRRRRWRKPS